MRTLEEFEATPYREFTNYNESQLKLARYLLGYDVPSCGRLVDPKEERLPLLNTALSTHLREVDRFLFNGGIQLDIKGAPPDDPRQLLVNRVATDSNLNSFLSELWQLCALYGEAALTYHRGTTKLYPLHTYTADEFRPSYDRDDNLTAIAINLLRATGKKIYLHRQWIDGNKFVTYPPVDLRLANSYNWAANRQEQLHGWGTVPAVVIKNRPGKPRGYSEFNAAALDMASELAIAYLDSASNHHAFANPLYVSPDPEETLKALKARVQVLRAEAPEDGGAPSILAPQGMPTSHFELIDRLERNLAECLGRSHGSQQAPPDTSSLTLRLLNAKTISLAESHWANYVDNGLLPLFQKILLSSAIDGIITGVRPGNTDLTARRLKPYFPISPGEQTQQLAIADALIGLGVRREVALREYYQGLPDEDILALMEGT